VSEVKVQVQVVLKAGERLGSSHNTDIIRKMSTSKTDQKPKPKPKSVFDFGGFGFFPIHSDGKKKKKKLQK
jgi:hypothetical protein